MAKNLQGLPEFTAGPAVLTTLGWFSLSACVDRKRLMFLYGLVNLPNDNLYRMITVNRTIDVCNKTNLVDPKGPICLLYDTCVKYDLNECLYTFMIGSSTLSKGEWKNMISLNVMYVEKELWYIKINLYSSLKLFRGGGCV